MTQRDSCEICGTKSSSPVIDLPDLPLTEIYSSELIQDKVGVANQGLDFCDHCGHAQLSNVVDVELQYGETFSYFFRTGESASGRSSIDYFIDFMSRTCGDEKFNNILEVGCNDLYLLNQLEDRANSLTGIDPMLKDIGENMSKGKITAIGDFFENVKLDDHFDVIICKDTLEHVANPKEFTKRLIDQAHEDTFFYMQFPCLESTIEDLRFDQVFHQHLNYFTVQTVIHMLNDLNCNLIDIDFNYEHWGALAIAFKKGEYNGKFDQDIWRITREDISQRYNVFKQEMSSVNSRLEYFKNERIYGYGAALMLPVLSYFLDNDLSCLECIVDDDPRKDGLYYLNLPVQIRGRDAIENEREAIFFLTAVASLSNVRRILPNLFKFRPKHVIVPMTTM